nr:hypothetical protein [Tanacetum cinerariifolium]
MKGIFENLDVESIMETWMKKKYVPEKSEYYG